MSDVTDLKPALPKTGQLIVEDIEELVLCKPRLIPLKSFTLEKLERMQQAAQKLVDEHSQESSVEED